VGSWLLATLKPTFDTASLLSIIQTELAVHPLCSKVDIYKLMFQALYGPTHMIPDEDLIIKGIINERSAMKTTFTPLVQDIGSGNAFYRISLSLLPDIAPVREAQILCQYIMSSRQAFDTDWDEWGKTWKVIDLLLYANSIHFIDINDDIDALLNHRSIPSHSSIYHDNYIPHYRLVHHSFLPKLLAELK
jgi:hypothetical protein